MLANYQEGKLAIELSNNLYHPENTKESLAQLLIATTTTGINKKNYLKIKENFEKCLKLLETKDCKVPENDRPEIRKSLKDGIKVIDRIFINPKLPPPQQQKERGILA